jgi:hypothetical protein
MPKFTHFDLLEITEQENDLKMLFSEEKKEEMYSPKKQTVANILNYSKALSIRKSAHLGFIETLLN